MLNSQAITQENKLELKFSSKKQLKTTVISTTKPLTAKRNENVERSKRANTISLKCEPQIIKFCTKT